MKITNIRRYIHEEIIRLSKGHWVCQVRVDIGTATGSHWGQSLYITESPKGFESKTTIAWLAESALDNCLKQTGSGYCGVLAVQFAVPSLQKHYEMFYVPMKDVSPYAWELVKQSVHTDSSRIGEYWYDHDEEDRSHVVTDAEDLMHTLQEQLDIVRKIARGGLDSVTQDEFQALSFSRTDAHWCVSRLRAALLENDPSLDSTYQDLKEEQ